MTFDGLLTFFGIIIAIYAIASPVQRRSLTLFVSLGWFIFLLLISFFLIVLRTWSGLCQTYQVLFSILSFIIPVIAMVYFWHKWNTARLTDRNINNFTDVLKASLREKSYDEIERILQENKGYLPSLSPELSYVLFDRQIIKALFIGRSFIHLEVLADMIFLKSLKNRIELVDAVVRELLYAENSPIRSAVIREYGGAEGHLYMESEISIVEKTFLNPKWYFEAVARYPLNISSIEELQSGKLDFEYNQISPNYMTSQGISSRSHCVIFLAIKTQVLAIKEAIKCKEERDFYLTNLYEVFRAVLNRSNYQAIVWEGKLSNESHPTPYAFLLYQITNDIRELSSEAVRVFTQKDKNHWWIEPPGNIVNDLAQAWALCVREIALSKGNVSNSFLQQMIVEYLNFVLKLGFNPKEIYCEQAPDNITGMEKWKELFKRELIEKFIETSGALEIIMEALERLDIGKSYISKGKQWLKEIIQTSFERERT